MILPDHLSVSSANLWGQCPRQWHARYVLGIVDEPGPEAALGTAAHAVLEILGSVDCEERGPTSVRTAIEACGSGVDLTVLALHVEAGLDSMPDTASTCERKLECDVDGVPFLGYVDRIEEASDGIRVVDIKTGKRPARDAWMADKFNQVEVYAAALEEIDDCHVTRGQLVWTAHGREDEWEITEQAKNVARAWLRATWEDIGDAVVFDHFPVEPGPLCSWCPAAKDCIEGTAAIRARAGAGRSLGPHAAHIAATVEGS